MAGQQITISIKQIGDRSHLLKDKASKIGIESYSRVPIRYAGFR